MIWDILILIGVIWIYLSLLSFMQNLYIRKAQFELKDLGTTYFGKTGRFLNTKMIVLAGVDKSGEIVGAKLLKPARIFIPPKLISFDDIVGRNIWELHEYTEDEKVKNALENLEENYKKANLT